MYIYIYICLYSYVYYVSFHVFYVAIYPYAPCGTHTAAPWLHGLRFCCVAVVSKTAKCFAAFRDGRLLLAFFSNKKNASFLCRNGAFSLVFDGSAESVKTMPEVFQKSFKRKHGGVRRASGALVGSRTSNRPGYLFESPWAPLGRFRMPLLCRLDLGRGPKMGCCFLWKSS